MGGQGLAGAGNGDRQQPGLEATKGDQGPLGGLETVPVQVVVGLELDSVAGLGVGQGGTAWLGLLTGPGPGDSAFGSRGRQGRAGLADTDT